MSKSYLDLPIPPGYERVTEGIVEIGDLLGWTNIDPDSISQDGSGFGDWRNANVLQGHLIMFNMVILRVAETNDGVDPEQN